MKQQLREFRNKILRKRLKNHDFTIISNNCLAGCVYHDLNLRFDTPTVNLYIPFPDYICFLKNIKQLVSAELVEIPYKACPVELLGVIRVYFLHYQSFKDGVETWKRRAARIHWDNLYIVLSERDGCFLSDLEEFEKLPFSNKVAFTHLKYPSLASCFYLKGNERSHELGNIMNLKGLLGGKIYDQFNWVKFLNKK